MKELFKCWLYINSVHREYKRYHGNLSDKVIEYENVLYQCFRDNCREFYDKYVGRLVRTRNGDIGAICSIYTDIPSIVIKFDNGIQTVSIHHLELI